MAKNYWLTFGTDPRVNTGLTPTLVIFADYAGATLTPPGITEPLAGSGFYTFSYGPTLPIMLLADGGSVLSDNDRYTQGVLDPVSVVDQRVGTDEDSFGSTSVDPTTVMGYVKRNLEFNEGNANFDKSTGTWDIYSRGSSTLLREKNLTNTTGAATKS